MKTFKLINLGLALVLSVGTMAAIGCTAQTDAEEEQAVGTLRLPLVTPTQTTFRLHDATFEIKTQSGTLVTTLDSDSDPDADALTTSLAQGNYTVRLKDGWELDSVAADGTESVIDAALISANPQSFNIKSAADTDISFSFTTDLGTVTIGNGSVNVSVSVGPNTTFTSCDLTSSYNYNCSTGKTCLLADSSGHTFCATPGSLPVGSACTSEQCVAGSQCLKLDPANPTQGTCTKFCNTSSPPFGCNCVSLGFENSNAGICGDLPANACDLLDQTTCPTGQACQYTSGGFGTCGTPGTTASGAACSAETCAAGYDCYNGYCRAICDTRNGFSNNPACSGSGYYYSYCYDAGTGYAGRCLY